MSTPDQPETPPLTRRQLREIRNTGATPIVTAESYTEATSPTEAEAVEPEAATPEPAEPEVVEPEVVEPEVVEPEAAEPEVVEAEAEAEPVVDESEAEGIEPDEHEPHEHDDDAGANADSDLHVDEQPAGPDSGIVDETQIPSAATAGIDPHEVVGVAHEDLGVGRLTRRQAREQERIRTASVPIITPDIASAPPVSAQPVADEHPIQTADAQWSEPLGDGGAELAPENEPPVENEPEPESRAERVESGERHVALVNPQLGSGLLAGETPIVELPPSFDQLIARNGSSTGSSSTPNALILSQTPSAAPLVAPVTATGEVLITGSFDLPAGLGSVGHGPGVHDGKDVDAVLVDGELPAASSPTPIAASAAISTVRNNDEIIRPPAPEKGSRLVVALAVTAGALLLTVVGLIGLAIATGAF